MNARAKTTWKGFDYLQTCPYKMNFNQYHSFSRNKKQIKSDNTKTGKSMERKTYPRVFTEAELGEYLNNFLLGLDEDCLRSIMAQIVNDEGYGSPIYNEKNEAIFMINIDPSKLSHNNSRKMVTAYTFMDVEDIRKFLRDLYYKSCIDQDTRGAKIRCDLRLEGQRVVSQVKVREEGDSDFDEVGDEDEDESLFEEVLGGTKEGDAVWQRRVWFAIEKMRAPQLRRAIHMICGGVYKLSLPADEEYINEKEDLDLRRIIAVIFIIGTRVVLTHEAESCDLLEEMTADELKKTLLVLCNSERVSLPNINGKQLTIDGCTITLEMCGRVKPQSENSSESANQSPSESEEQDTADEYPEEGETSDYGVEVEASDEDLYEPESPNPRKRARLWVESSQLLGPRFW
ncbi:hypothetical protein BHYA_0038g00180 [Botrytis hyacinthi]|uniref:Uncharacterized protein n=1 Tax=Botrytis hyacinthi TaxID=278943 RepID=A0A4Z1GTW1_9HELO|nr:hypothetical protein BHYA_0038g00180 [Botrytis hyacinthi]